MIKMAKEVDEMRELEDWEKENKARYVENWEENKEENKVEKRDSKQKGFGRITGFWRENQVMIQKAFRVAWPAVLESFFVAFVGIVDSMMVSRLGTYAVAAVGLTTQPKFLGLALFIATNMAVSALVARRKGEKNREEANGILVTAACWVVFAAIVVSVICVTFSDLIIYFAGSKVETHRSAVLYFRIIMGGMLFHVVSLVINAALRGSGNTRIAMKTNVTSNVVNILFNYLLIEGHFGFPALGIAGAAIATVLGTMFACMMSIASLFRADGFVSLRYIRRQNVRPKQMYAAALFGIASNTFIEQIFIRIGFMVVSVMAAKLGTNEFAAHQVGMNIMSLSFSFGDGMQTAAITLIGQSLGQKLPDLAKRYGTICQRIGNMISIVLSVLYLFLGKWFFGLYFKEPELIELGGQIMEAMVFIVLMQIAQVIYMGCLRGAGDVRFTTIASTICITVIRPVTSYLFAYLLGFGIIGIWIGVVCDQISRLVLTSWRFRSGKWTQIRI